MQERQREAETSEVATDRWIPTGIASSVGGKCHHTVATSTVCIILILVDQSGPDGDQSGPEGPAVPLDHCEPLWTIVDQSGPATVMAEIVDEGTIVDQSGPATVMAEIVDEGTRWGPEGPPDLDISGPLWTRREHGDA